MGQNVNENKAMTKIVIANINKKNVNENKAMTKVVIAINKKNVNENKAMTKVVIANINGAECEQKQGNDEGRHCNNPIVSVLQICHSMLCDETTLNACIVQIIFILSFSSCLYIYSCKSNCMPLTCSIPTQSHHTSSQGTPLVTNKTFIGFKFLLLLFHCVYGSCQIFTLDCSFFQNLKRVQSDEYRVSTSPFGQLDLYMVSVCQTDRSSPSVLRMLHACDCCGPVRSRIIPDWAPSRATRYYRHIVLFKLIK